jgi:phosphoribosylformylglycinamidine synthase
VTSIDVADVYFVSAPLEPHERQRIEALLVDPHLQSGSWALPGGVAIETSPLPGVTDPVAAALDDAARQLGIELKGAASGRRYEIAGDPSDSELTTLATKLLSNPVIERMSIGRITPAFVDGSMPAAASVIPVRGLGDEDLLALNRDRGMALDVEELRVIAAHFGDLGRDPTDVELETLAQTWSEHCSHKTFRARITLDDGTEVAPLLRQLRDATDALGASFVRSAFVGNAGIVSFHADTTIAVKAETHNHPSAVEPFGGANTGVGGVIRDVMGAGHRPIATTDVLCFGPTGLAPGALPAGVLHPRLVEAGVVAGVADYGNKIGLPTVAGAVLYDPGFTANPLVFCGCIGVAPEREMRMTPNAGDLVVVLGGRTGRDGLRGATFSSAAMDATTGDVAGASVQIGDPITEKLLIDLLADAAEIYSAITDCGAGGLSSAIGEMAEGVGADVDVALAPLKYPGLAPWEVWLSEAQERMVVAVAPERLALLGGLADHHGVELTVLGRFTGDGVLRVRAGADLVLELDTGFLHEGRPQRSMDAVRPQPAREPVVPVVRDHGATLLALLAHPNIASKEPIIRRYDHEIGGATVVRPLVGVGADAPADGVVLAAPGDRHGIAIGIGVNPWYGITDPWRMAHAAVDEAIRNVVAVGADPDAVALMDNFSWGDPRRPSTLGALVEAVEACCAASLAHGAPFVSGKDSLNNEYLGSDGERHSVPPTLVVTAVAHVADAGCVVTPDLAAPGNLLVLVGHTRPELGGSHLGFVGASIPDGAAVPAPDPAAPARYRGLHRAIRSGRVLSCHDLSEGGLGVALAEMAIGGGLGVDSPWLAHDDLTVALFSESTGRFVCEIAPHDVEWLAAEIGEPVHILGAVTDERLLRLGPIEVTLEDARMAFAGTPRDGVAS